MTAPSLPHGPAQLLIGHVAVLFLLPPELGHGLRAEELEHTLMPVLPFHEAFVELRVDEDVSNELPQMSTSGGYKRKISSVISSGCPSPPGHLASPIPMLRAKTDSPFRLPGQCPLRERL